MGPIKCCCRFQWVPCLNCLDLQTSALHSQPQGTLGEHLWPPPALVISPHTENTAQSPKKRQARAGSSLWSFSLRLLLSSDTPTLPARCQSSSADSWVTPGHELTGAVVFLPCHATSLLLNPVKQESTGGLHEGPQE